MQHWRIMLVPTGPDDRTAQRCLFEGGQLEAEQEYDRLREAVDAQSGGTFVLLQPDGQVVYAA